MPETTDVLIVGAGPTGLALAAGLARRGVGFRLIDKLDEPAGHSRAIGIQARTLEMMEIEGIAQRFTDLGVKLHGARAYDRGREIVHLTFDRIHSDYPYLLALPQTETERILAETVQQRGGRIERGVALTGLRQDDEGVDALLANPDGSEGSVRCRWVAGCDGAHSTVRHLLNLPFEGEEYHETFILADVRLAPGLPQDELHADLTDAVLLLMVPLPDGVWRLVADHAAAPERPTEPSADEIRAIARARGPTVPQIRDVLWTSRFRIHRRIVSTMQHRRAFLLGDAAHIHSPAGAQGMNTGIQDAMNLAWKLALAVHGRAAPGLLESYNAERMPVERDVLRFSDRALKVVEMRGDLARWVRDTLLHALTGLAAVRDRLGNSVAQLAVNYRDSPIVEGGGEGWLRAGDRVPNLPLAGETTVYEALQAGRHILVSGAAEPELEPAIAPYGDVVSAPHLVARAPDGAADPAIHGDAVALVRPDGYVGYCGPAGDPEGMARYMARVFAAPHGSERRG